ncbi:hypothetical protein WR25_03139 [Diploscapter pachys]|uniref:Uncharacterized protein n=1 Tax=Diploscapter pachys TaxID=2018661 RepID=A0A2A2M2X0_9BILA|nr:hypothetical protein WR25_03139 [Diploscapter pachys]
MPAPNTASTTGTVCDREHAAEADRAGAERQPHLPPLERAEFAQRTGAAIGTVDGGQHGDEARGGQRQQRDKREHPAPARHLPQPGRDRHTDDRRDGQAQHHAPDRLRALRGRHQRRSDERGDPEIGAMRQACEESEREHPAIRRREGGQRVADREQRHQPDQQAAPCHTGRQHRDRRCADHHAQGVGADDMPHGRRVDAQPAGQVRLQAHRRKFGRPDRKPADGKRKMDEAGMRLGSLS